MHCGIRYPGIGTKQLQTVNMYLAQKICILDLGFCTRTILSSLKNDPGLAFCSASMYGQNCGFLGAWHFVGHLLGNCLHFGDDFFDCIGFH